MLIRTQGQTHPLYTGPDKVVIGKMMIIFGMLKIQPRLFP